jgi:hypothetical protein
MAGLFMVAEFIDRNVLRMGQKKSPCRAEGQREGAVIAKKNPCLRTARGKGFIAETAGLSSTR